MQNEFSLKHLNSTQFEELCFELLKELGFKNVDWRKGTGLSSSPSDQGRDIEANNFIKDIDGEITSEKWFFECKHYTKGVPPEKLQGAISWSNSERPDKLVIIVSAFLSNPSKLWIDNFIQNNKPYYKIKIWELKELEDLLYDKVYLKNKYKLNPKIEFLDLLHPSHIRYSLRPSLNTLAFFFELMDKLKPSLREYILSSVKNQYIIPRYRKALHPNETIGELRIDANDYNTFKSKCNELKDKSIGEIVLVKSIVNSCLEWAFHFGDKSKIGEVTETHQGLIKHMKTQNDLKADLKMKMIKDSEIFIETLPKRTHEAYEKYVVFCEEVVAKLSLENIFERRNFSEIK